MTNMQLLEAIGMLDDETILDAEQESVRRASVLSTPHGTRLVRQNTALAACVCLLFGGALAAQMGGWGKAKDSDVSSEPSDPMTSVPTADGDMTVTTTFAQGHEGVFATTTTAQSSKADAIYTTTMAYTTTAATSTAATTTRVTTTAGAADPATEIAVPAEGLLVYSEDFNGYSDTELSLGTPDALGWTKLTVAEDTAYSESDVAFALRDGRLYFDNYDTAGDTFGDGTLTRGQDAYFAIPLLNDRYMEPVVAGKYTLEYDLEYSGAANVSRYAVLITELSADRQCYNSFHLRIGGLANHQCRFYGSWKTYSAYDPATDLNPSADDPTGAEGAPLVKKLLGLELGEVAEKQNMAGVRVTIRLCWDPAMGHHVYMKTADMESFVKVSEPSVKADGIMYLGWRGYAVALKIGGAVDGYIDNIRIWTGWGNAPSDRWYQPPK